MLATAWSRRGQLPPTPNCSRIRRGYVAVVEGVGQLGVGVALASGVALRVAAAAGTVMMALMWAAEWPLARHLSDGSLSMSANPLVDYHVLYAAILVTLAAIGAGRTWGLGTIWERLPLVRRNRWLL